MNENEAVELYRKHRPGNFKGLLGQSDAVKQLQSMLVEDKIPHALILSGHTGCGKTTTARILKKRLNCSDMDFSEINAAESRGIDTIREINQRKGLSAIGGKCRIYLLDEAHKLTSDAQT